MNNIDINKLVAEKVMGWKWEKINTYYGKYIVDEDGSSRIDDEWKPSTNMSDAWEVVEKVGSENFGTEIRYLGSTVEVVMYNGWNRNSLYKTAFSEKASMAICLAALKIKGVELANEKAAHSAK